jgi:hypothetical protein
VIQSSNPNYYHPIIQSSNPNYKTFLVPPSSATLCGGWRGINREGRGGERRCCCVPQSVLWDHVIPLERSLLSELLVDVAERRWRGRREGGEGRRAVAEEVALASAARRLCAIEEVRVGACGRTATEPRRGQRSCALQRRELGEAEGGSEAGRAGGGALHQRIGHR